MESYNNLTQKLEFVRDIYRRKNKSGILLEKQNNISWLFSGRTHVNLATVNGVVDVFINDEAVYLISNNIEAERMVNEEFEFDMVIKKYDWFDAKGRENQLAKISDTNFTKDSDCEDEISQFRVIMSESDKKRYITLGVDTAEVMQQTCQTINSGSSEFETAGIMAKKFLERGIEPIILLVAADERIFKYRHPLPTSKIINDYVMLVAGGRRNGKIACITRFVSFSGLTDEISHKRDAVLYLDTLLFKETKPKACTLNIFHQLIENYGLLGYPNEWKLHHQGGLTGYNSREHKVSFGQDIKVTAGQVYAWNPSITGFKAEDTFIVEDTGNIILTETSELPYKDVCYKGENLKRPDILIRKKQF